MGASGNNPVELVGRVVVVVEVVVDVVVGAAVVVVGSTGGTVVMTAGRTVVVGAFFFRRSAYSAIVISFVQRWSLQTRMFSLSWPTPPAHRVPIVAASQLPNTTPA